MRFLCVAAVAVALVSMPAGAAVVASVDVSDDSQGAFVWNYTGPEAGYEQTFQLKYAGLSPEGDWENSLSYTIIRQADAFDDSTTFQGKCYVPELETSTCERSAEGYKDYPSLTFSQTATPGLVTFTIRNEPFYLDPTCHSVANCYGRYGYVDSAGKFVGVFGQGQTGHYDFIAFDPTPVPEAAAWLMLILGFGLVGSTLRVVRHSNRTFA